MALTEYSPGERFPGVIGRTTDESTPAWPASTQAKDGAPNDRRQVRQRGGDRSGRPERKRGAGFG